MGTIGVARSSSSPLLSSSTEVTSADDVISDYLTNASGVTRSDRPRKHLHTTEIAAFVIVKLGVSLMLSLLR